MNTRSTGRPGQRFAQIEETRTETKKIEAQRSEETSHREVDLRSLKLWRYWMEDASTLKDGELCFGRLVALVACF